MSRPYQRLFRILLGVLIIGFVYLVVMGINSLSCRPNSPALFSEMVDTVDSGLSKFFLSGEQSLKAHLGYESLRALEVKLGLDNSMNIDFRLAPLLGLIGLSALFAIFRRLLRRRQVKEDKTSCLHMFAKTVKLTPHVFQVCGTCRASVRYTAHESVCAAGVWIIEIALNSSLVRKATSRAIQELALPVIRREINLIVIGVYRNKVEATAVIKLLKEKYDVRGWVVQGN